MVFMGELIQDLGTLARAERGDLKVQLELVDPGLLAADLVRDYQPQAESKNLKLKLELGENLGQVFTSPPELREILQNFLTNALKYTQNGSITIKVDVAPDGTNFTVSDTGIGLSASDKNKIFQKFYRSEDYRTRQTGGTGLGLYITHKLAEKLGITISFTSRLNHGSAFTVHVPALTEKEANTALAQAAGSTLKIK
jgi:signal transduction histidine kinase